MAWIMDTYSMQVGYSVPGVVTGKPSSSVVRWGGGGTGRGVVYCVQEACARQKMPYRGRALWYKGLAMWGL